MATQHYGHFVSRTASGTARAIRTTLALGLVTAPLAVVPSIASAQEMEQGAYACFRVDTARVRHDAIGTAVEVIYRDRLTEFEVEAGPNAEVCFPAATEAGDVKRDEPALVCLDVTAHNPDRIDGILLELNTVFSGIDGVAFEPSRLCFAAEGDARARGER